MGACYFTVKVSTANDAAPVNNADVLIKNTNGEILFRLKTDASGRTEPVSLSTPDKILTMDPNYGAPPYSVCRVEVNAPGFVPEVINGVQLFDGVDAVEEVDMHPDWEAHDPINIINIPPHKQVLSEPFDQHGTNQTARVMPRVIIPEFITVHLGRYNVSARNIRVPFPLYIKNVASSEIYPTWPEASLEANIRAIINFALNRIYTEWYHVRGFNFDITNSTSTDMYFVEGRDIFSSISVIVDRAIGEFLRRPGHNEPFFTEFCDGRTASCPGMSQWGTVTLAERGMAPLQILRYYYPDDLFIDTAPIAPITESFPGVNLSQGSQGPDVERMQRFLNRIRQNYPLIPNIANPNGIYGTDTVEAVRVFQQIFDLPQTGVVDRATWNKIFYLFVAVTKLAELTSEGDRIVTGTVPPNTVIRIGSSGGLVARLQYMLSTIALFFPEIPEPIQDGAFGSGTRDAVTAFQNKFGLTPDGIVGPSTWIRLYEVYNAVRETVPPTTPPAPPPTGPVYPSAPLRLGSHGSGVRIMQEYLNALASVYPNIPRIAVDGVFGQTTERAVIAFQRQFGLAPDGVIGPLTWSAIVTQYDRLPVSPPAGPAYPGVPLRIGSRGDSVKIMQAYLNALGELFPAIPRLAVDGVFGPITESAVIAFQRQFGLAADGIIGPVTWNAIVTQYNNL